MTNAQDYHGCAVEVKDNAIVANTETVLAEPAVGQTFGVVQGFAEKPEDGVADPLPYNGIQSCGITRRAARV